MTVHVPVAVAVEGVSKRFEIPHSAASLRQWLTRLGRAAHEPNYALADVSFSIPFGEFFGIIGPNGSGKSTLLRLIAGIYSPTSGRIVRNGGISPFIELGVGFNPELSARDNVWINGTLLGLSRRELHARFEEILAFAELERFVDQQLKNFSTGMQLRLAYAIAIQVRFPILLLDEVLAVGDERFLAKCHQTFLRMKEEGRTVVLVSHNLEWVTAFCDRVVQLEAGVVRRIGPPQDVIDAYVSETAGPRPELATAQ